MSWPTSWPARGIVWCLVARRAERLEELAARLRDRPSPGAEVHVLPADLADPEAPGRLVAEAVDRLGGLDVLINNAGLGLPRFFGESEPDDLARQLAVNLIAPLLLTRHALPHLIASRGLVINIGSAISAMANPSLGAYGTTKAGLAYFTEALRREVRHKGVRVCLVEPGPVETEFFEAVQSRARDGRKALGASPPSDGLYNALRDRPPRFLAIRRPATPRAGSPGCSTIPAGGSPSPAAPSGRGGRSGPSSALSPAWATSPSRRWPRGSSGSNVDPSRPGKPADPPLSMDSSIIPCSDASPTSWA